VTWVAEQLKDQAERELYDPAVVRRHLEEVAAAKERGAISEEQASAIERELVARLLEGTRRQSEEH
jgi:chorismate mutase